MILNSDGQEELKYIIKNNCGFITYKCPFISDMCYLKNKSISDRWKKRWICIKCKGYLLRYIKE